MLGNRVVRPQDLVWLLLFSALASVSPTRSRPEIAMLLCLAVFQVIEPKVRYFATGSGTVAAILIKFGLCYLLIGWTGGISSSYHVILLLPVVSAATTLNGIGTAATTALACLSYLSFLLFVDWRSQELGPSAIGEIGLRVIFLPVVSFLTYQLAEANRVEARNFQAVAGKLAAANRSLEEAEAAVRRSDRLAALGQLTAGLAHELRNPLGTMRASAEMLEKNLREESAINRELAGFIASEVDRTNSLITRFLDFARPLHLRMQPAQIAEMTDRAIAELERHHPAYAVSVYRNYAPDIPPLRMDGELMERVIYNLLLNAAQATPAGGSITLKIRRLDQTVEISVIDRGSGIARQHLENIFNPFFTTKSDGVGLGLAIVSKIVDEHGGKLEVESETGSGSVFRVYLPVPPAASGIIGRPVP
ncbi:MAG TPA: ATP-binding protein [Bryobacteraceae bacterium]|nr:ATP-binding protein [Bryobacteraceae bacterium]